MAEFEIFVRDPPRRPFFSMRILDTFAISRG